MFACLRGNFGGRCLVFSEVSGLFPLPGVAFFLESKFSLQASDFGSGVRGCGRGNDDLLDSFNVHVPAAAADMLPLAMNLEVQTKPHNNSKHT